MLNTFRFVGVISSIHYLRLIKSNYLGSENCNKCIFSVVAWVSELAETEIYVELKKTRFQFNRLLIFLLMRNTTPEPNIKTKSAGKLRVNVPNPGGASSEKTKYIQDLSDPFG